MIESNIIYLKMTPLARRIAKERGIDARAVQGSGHGGKIYSYDLSNVPDGYPRDFAERMQAPAPVYTGGRVYGVGERTFGDDWGAGVERPVLQAERVPVVEERAYTLVERVPGVEKPAYQADWASGIEMPAYQADWASGIEEQASGMEIPVLQGERVSGIEERSWVGEQAAGVEIPVVQAERVSAIEERSWVGEQAAGVEIPVLQAERVSSIGERAFSAERASGMEIPVLQGERVSGIGERVYPAERTYSGRERHVYPVERVPELEKHVYSFEPEAKPLIPDWARDTEKTIYPVYKEPEPEEEPERISKYSWASKQEGSVRAEWAPRSEWIPKSERRARQGLSVQESPAREAFAPEASAPDGQVQDGPVAEAPAPDGQVQDGPVAEALAPDSPAAEAFAREAPAPDGSALGSSFAESSASDGPALGHPFAEAPAPDSPAKDSPAAEAPVREAYARETSALDGSILGSPFAEAYAPDGPAQERGYFRPVLDRAKEFFQIPPREKKEAMVNAAIAADEDIAGVLRMNETRRATAVRTAQSSTQTAAVTQHMEIDVTALIALSKHLNKGRDNRHIIPLTAFYLRAMAVCVKELSRFRLRLAEKEDAYLLIEDAHVGFQVEAGESSAAPVVRNADMKTLDEIAADILVQTEKVTRGSIIKEETGGSAITLIDKNGSGIHAFTPIINLPEAAALGIGTIYKRLVMANKGIEDRQFVMQSLTFDHRVINGNEADEFQRKLKELLENPMSLVG